MHRLVPFLYSTILYYAVWCTGTFQPLLYHLASSPLLAQGVVLVSEDLSGSSVCGLSSMLKMRCAALLILGVLTAVNGLKCYKNDAGSGSDTTQECPSGTTPSYQCHAIKGPTGYGQQKLCGTGCANYAGYQCTGCTTDFCNTAYPGETPSPAAAAATPAAPAVTVQTDPLASSATGCFEGWAGAWKARTGCTCPSTCRTCYHSGFDNFQMTAEECLACKGTDKHTVVSTTVNTGTCTASAAAMLQAGTVVSAILAFAVALASA